MNSYFFDIVTTTGVQHDFHGHRMGLPADALHGPTAWRVGSCACAPADDDIRRQLSFSSAIIDEHYI